MNDITKNMLEHVTEHMSEKDKMLAGRLYRSNDDGLRAERAHARLLLKLFNDTAQDEPGMRKSSLQRLFGSAGGHLEVEPPFRCDYGYNILVGDNFHASFDCAILDCAKVLIGSNVYLGPGVHIYTAAHPLEVEIRNGGQEWAQPVVIGDNVWIGGRAVIQSGVTIGAGSTIGPGSVVTRDIPANVLAVGNPCRVVRVLRQGAD